MYYPLETKAVPVVDITTLTREEWLELRKKGIGGSDCGTVFGLSPFKTRRDLYYDKIGVAPAVPDDSNWVQKEYGTVLEDLVAKVFAYKTGYELIKIPILYRHPVHDFMFVNIDYFYRKPDGSINILECKTTGSHSKNAWATGPPLHYEMQCRHAQCVMAINEASIACLYGNSENDFIFYTIQRDLSIESTIIQEEKQFWQDHVLKRIPPLYIESGKLVIQSVRNYYANNTKSDIRLSSDYIRDIEAYEKLKNQKSSIENEMKAIQGRLLDGMENAASAYLDTGKGKVIISNGISHRRSVDYDKLQAQYPDIYDQFVRESLSRKFSIKL